MLHHVKKRALSFKYAFEGIWVALIEEPNLKFHLIAAILVIFLGLYYSISYIEWLIVITIIGMVIAIELTNTAIETIVDSFTLHSHPGAKKAKDIAAGAVLVVSLTAICIGIIIFFPYLANSISSFNSH